MHKLVLAFIVAVSGLTSVCAGDISDSKAFVRSGSAFVPVRPIFEWFGAEVSFDKGVINATKGRKEVQLTVGKSVATVNGKEVALSNPPFVSNGVTYVPLRFLADAFGAEVNFDSKAQTVTIQARGRTAIIKVASESLSVEEAMKKFVNALLRRDTNLFLSLVSRSKGFRFVNTIEASGGYSGNRTYSYAELQSDFRRKKGAYYWLFKSSDPELPDVYRDHFVDTGSWQKVGDTKFVEPMPPQAQQGGIYVTWRKENGKWVLSVVAEPQS